MPRFTFTKDRFTFTKDPYVLKWTSDVDDPIQVYRKQRIIGKPGKVAEIGYGPGYVTWNASNRSSKTRHAPAIRRALLELYQGHLAHYAPLTRFVNWPINELDATEIH